MPTRAHAGSRTPQGPTGNGVRAGWGRDYSSKKAARGLPRMRRQKRARVGFLCRTPGRREGHGARGPPLRAQAQPPKGPSALAHGAVGASALRLGLWGGEVNQGIM